MSKEEGDAVKVAVRVRPFNSREVKLGMKKPIIKMEGPRTTITDPVTGNNRDFTFDYSYWSFSKDDANFADNPKVYNDLGVLVLNNAWAGYNVCLFAYGQTGAGKSYSMVGYGKDFGIVPMAMEEIFKRIAANTDKNKTYTVEASMLEIYNETLKDLFNPSNNPKGGLQLRDLPQTGPFVDGLLREVVTSYDHISKLMDDGNKVRTVGETEMNKTSSRAHTVFQIVLTCTTFDETTKKSSKTTSQINLVDLAGSERASKTNAQGGRLKEGCAINLSLTTLGKCISALAKASNATSKAERDKVFVPYRESKLTFLLKNSLGGNSRTIMIAAISPSPSEYEDTLSTLRYADNAKQIVNKAVVNEDANAKVIRELKTEIEELKRLLKTGGGVRAGDRLLAPGDDADRAKAEAEHREYEEMKRRMEQNEAAMREMTMSWEEKVKESQLREEQRLKRLEEEQLLRKTVPHLVNLHQDMMMSETICYFFREGRTRVVRPDADPPPGPNDIALRGLLIQKEHADVQNEGKITITPCADAKVFVNGILIRTSTELQHNDRVVFGSHHVFRFVLPSAASATDDHAKFDWQFAQLELTEAAMRDLAPLVQDEAAAKAREEAERKAAALEEQLRAQQESNRAAQVEAEEKRRQVLEEMERAKREEIERLKHEMGEVADAKKQAELAAALKEREERLRLEQDSARKEWEAKWMQEQQASRKEKEELEKQLNKQLQENTKLQRKREMEDRDKMLLSETLMQTIPMVSEANIICGELNQPLKFDIQLRAKKSTDVDSFTEKTEVLTKVVDLNTNIEVLWDHEFFTDRLYEMRQIHQPLLEDPDAEVEIPAENNPFELRSAGPQLLGNSRIFLQPLYYLFGISEKTPVIDYKGETQGHLSVKLRAIPQGYESDHDDKAKGRSKKEKKEQKEADADDDEDEAEAEAEFDEENVDELKDQLLEIRLEVFKAMGVPKNFSHNVYIQYKFFLDEGFTKTEPAETSLNPRIGHKRTIIVDPVTEDFIDYLKNGLIELQVFGEVPPEGTQAQSATIKVHSRSASRNSEFSDAEAKELLEVRAALEKSGTPGRSRSVSAAVHEVLEENKKLRIEIQQSQHSPVVTSSAAPKVGTAPSGPSIAITPAETAELERLRLANAAKDAEIEQLRQQVLRAEQLANEKQSKTCTML